MALTSLACSDDNPATTSGTGGSAAQGGGAATGGQGGGTGGEGGAQGIPPDWSCLGSVTWDPPMAATVNYNVTYVDFITEELLLDLTAKACARTDTTCATPLDEQTTDETGSVQLTLPTGVNGFDGFIEVTGDGVAWINIVHRPLTEDEAFTEGIITDSGMITLAALLSSTVDAADGQLAFAVAECGPGDPIGAKVTTSNTDAGTELGFLRDSLPRKDVDDTDATGFGAFLNVPPGPSTITATVGDTGTQIATAEVFIRPGFVSFVFLPPSP